MVANVLEINAERLWETLERSAEMIRVDAGEPGDRRGGRLARRDVIHQVLALPDADDPADMLHREQFGSHRARLFLSNLV